MSLTASLALAAVALLSIVGIAAIITGDVIIAMLMILSPIILIVFWWAYLEHRRAFKQLKNRTPGDFGDDPSA